MSNKNKIIWLVFLLVFPQSSHVCAQSVMKIVYYNNYAPFSWEKNKQMLGILIDVMNESLAGRMGIAIDHQGYPWKRAQRLVKNHHADAFVTIPTRERRAYTIISREPAILSNFQLYVRAGHPRLESLQEIKAVNELDRFSLGNYLGNGWAKKNLAGMDVFWTERLDNTLKMLVKGRFDAFIGNSRVIRLSIKKQHLTQEIVELPNVFDVTTFNLCVGKESPFVYLVPMFDETIRTMRAEGALQRIYERYR